MFPKTKRCHGGQRDQNLPVLFGGPSHLGPRRQNDHPRVTLATRSQAKQGMVAHRFQEVDVARSTRALEVSYTSNLTVATSRFFLGTAIACLPSQSAYSQAFVGITQRVRHFDVGSPLHRSSHLARAWLHTHMGGKAMKGTSAVVLLAVLFVAAPVAYGQTSPVQVTCDAKGPAKAACSQLKKAITQDPTFRQSKNGERFEVWVSAFMDGSNAVVATSFNVFFPDVSPLFPFNIWTSAWIVHASRYEDFGIYCLQELYAARQYFVENLNSTSLEAGQSFVHQHPNFEGLAVDEVHYLVSKQEE